MSHEVTVEEVGGPFDLAFTRCFLMHQPDPRLTLERIAGLVRPGGWPVTQEPLWSPPPRSSPELAALARAWDVLRETTVHLGAGAAGWRTFHGTRRSWASSSPRSRATSVDLTLRKPQASPAGEPPAA